jgi:hypothetical protein
VNPERAREAEFVVAPAVTGTAAKLALTISADTATIRNVDERHRCPALRKVVSMWTFDVDCGMANSFPSSIPHSPFDLAELGACR